ncbi:MAG: sugar phosphate isomerase/epimerase [Lachnospiraceae bacterium]|nr:sugar phosphate isomerase/epimerase [Lachnospiraceae bacterium]
MNLPKIASPTYIFREEAPEKLPEILPRLAEIGFDGVELCTLFGWDVAEVERMLAETGLALAGDNWPVYDLMEHPEEVVEWHRRLGSFSLTPGGFRDEHLPGGEYFAEAKEWFARLGKLCREAGIRLLYHNHFKEMRKLPDGTSVLDALMAAVPETDLSMQPDLGWMQIGGGDPLYYLRKYAGRIPMVHFKDFYASDMAKIGDPFDLEGRRGGPERGHFEFRPTGYGISGIAVQVPHVLACRPAWVVTCQDTVYGRSKYDDLADGLIALKKNLSLYAQAEEERAEQ